jgi:hypothetical protein
MLGLGTILATSTIVYSLNNNKKVEMIMIGEKCIITKSMILNSKGEKR